MTNKEILQRLFVIIKPFRFKLYIAMFAMIMVAALSATQVYLIKDVLDKIFMEKNIFFLNMLPIVVVLVFFFKSIFYYIYQLLLEIVGQSIIRDLRIQIFNAIHSQPLSYFNQTPTGTLISRVISDVMLMQQCVSNALVGILRDIVQVVILLGVVFYMNWKLSLFAFIILPVAFFPIVKFGQIFRKLSTKTQEETAHVTNILHETITGNRIVKAFAREHYEGKRFSAQIHTLFNVTIKDARFRSMQHPMMELIGGIAIAGIIWFGGREVVDGEMTPGTFFALMTALIAAYDPVKGVSGLNSTIQQGLAASARVFHILDEVPEISDAENASALPEFTRAITFENIVFSYNKDGSEEGPVLTDINLRVTSGEALAIVGPSGSGKTTLTNLIPRFLEPDSGRLLIDGHDIREVTMESLRAKIAMVTQQTILFNDNVRNNIGYGNLDCSEQDVIDAAHAAHALDFINELPHGFQTIIGEGGSRLSGGERQRISIARALLKNAPILILDEATSALDTESEREVQKALENLMKDRTTFVIAHRLSTIKNADRIIVIKDGRIVEEGTHEELLALHGEYEILYRMQYN